MTTRGPRFTVEHVEAAWQVLLRDGDTVRAIPVLADPAPDLRPGPGPGGIVWRTTVAEGVAGIEASWRGTFKILPFTSSRYALFHERTSGDWLVLALGSPETLKSRAAEHAAANPEAPSRAVERASADPEAPARVAERAADPEAPTRAAERAAARPEAPTPDDVSPAVNTAAVTTGMSAFETDSPPAAAPAPAARGHQEAYPAAPAPAARERLEAYPHAQLPFRTLREVRRK